MEQVSSRDHEMVVHCHDKASGLRAIIAIHDTTLGPSLGGCRLWPYQSEAEALNDVLRLSRGMTYKAAVAGLPLGGGKAVIIGDPDKVKSEDLFRAFGCFVDSLGGRYITAEDVNMRVPDMAVVAEETPYVVGRSADLGGSGDPSPRTAKGVYWGIRAAVKHKLGRDSLDGCKISVQGLGAVGHNLCQLLAEEGAQLVVADISKEKVQLVADLYGAKIVSSEVIHKEVVDVYAPCALGAILNHKSISEINAPIVAGGANNQLANNGEDGLALHKRKILYAPDYVINAGGLISVSYEFREQGASNLEVELENIYNVLLKVFSKSSNADMPTHQASDAIAIQELERRLSKKGRGVMRNTFHSQGWGKA